MGYDHSNDFFTVQEIAGILRLSDLTLYKYIKDGSLEAIEFGGHYRVSRNALNAFILTHKVEVKGHE